MQSAAEKMRSAAGLTEEQKKEIRMEMHAVRTEMGALKPAIAEQQAPFDERIGELDQKSIEISMPKAILRNALMCTMWNRR